jgi:methyl-accepting chemotaxis protein
MVSLRNVRIARKFFYAFGTVCLLCTALGTAGVVGFVKSNSVVDGIVGNSIPSMKVLGDIRYDLATVRRSDALMLICDNSDCTRHYQEKREESVSGMKNDVAKYATLANLPGERDLYEAIDGNATAYLEISESGNNLIASGQAAEAKRLMMDKKTLDAYNNLVGAVQKAIALNDRVGSEQGQQAIHLGRTLLMALLVLMGVTVLSSAAIGFKLTQLIATPVIEATLALEKLAERDLTVEVNAVGQDEIGRLSLAFNTSVSKVREVLLTMARSVETLSAAAQQLTTRSTTASGNAEAQSGKTNQISVATQEMTATIGEISHNAEIASDASRKSASAAGEGGQVMQEASATMERIGTVTAAVADRMMSLDKRSQEIGRVITVIQEISEQTNLLALNAAIEAARAGEHGRGFAVVAGEVRRLAERTKGATEEIAATIRSIQEETNQTVKVMQESRSEVEIGMKKTADAYSSIEATIECTREVESMIQLIATAATEQIAASGEISESAAHISQLATENSHAAQETADACRSLASLSDDLDAVIRQFHLENGARAGGSLRPEPVRSQFVSALHRA